MAYEIKVEDSQKILPKMVAMTPYRIYMNQVKGMIDNIRYLDQGLTYIPPQLGGISGQRKVMDEVVVLQNIDFEVK